MACVTLKRSLDFDPLHSPSRPTKRRRCVPLQCSPDKKHREEPLPVPQPSVFRENPLTPEEIANNLRDEIKRLKKRKQFPGSSSSSVAPPSPSSAPSSPEPMIEEGGQSGGLTQGVLDQGQQSSHQVAVRDKPIFTLKQMTMIAERMCKERVEQVRLEYDQILQQKLSEQYDAFVKFIDQQIKKRFSESSAPSYLS